MAASSNQSRFADFPGPFISNLVLTDTQLGKGADATVFEAKWNGTVCAAKRLHDILLEDDSPGGVDRLVSNFGTECAIWAKLRHPGVVQFLGVYKDPDSLLPVLVMEKMHITLWKYLESRNKEQFPLHPKACVLLQVSQALAYLHSQDPPVVHHDLSVNNVLLNEIASVAKVSDFGMSRAVNLSSTNRKTSIKGTQAFMAPEALQKVPKYDTKLDVFSFGNLVISTVTHEWPTPAGPNKYEGDKLMALDELQRREYYTELFTAQEKQLFLPIVQWCLENRPDKRPSSMILVEDLSTIESSLKMDYHDADPTAQLQLHLLTKDDECRQEEALKGKDELIGKRDEEIGEKKEALREKVAVIRQRDEEIMEDEAFREKDAAIEALKERGDLSMERVEPVMEEPIPSLQVKRPTRSWKELGTCQKVIQHNAEGDLYKAVAVNSEGILALVDAGQRCVHILTKEGKWKSTIGKGRLGGFVQAIIGSDRFGVSFDLKGNVLVCAAAQNSVVKFSQDGELLQTISCAGRKCDLLKHPWGVCVSPEDQIYICDHDNHSVTVHKEDGRFLHAFGVRGNGPGYFKGPRDVAFGSDGNVYVIDEGKKVGVWSKEGDFQREFKTKHDPFYIAATGDNHLLITSRWSHTVMVYTLEGKLVHEFGRRGSERGRFDEPLGICIDDSGLVYVADCGNKRVQVF